jgi:uncharacterized protein YbjT (DUF2867 family)
MRILLTGANGLIGQRLLERLHARGHEVICAVRRAPDQPIPGVRHVLADFVQDTEKAVWLARLGGVEIVINTVGIFREQGGQDFERIHTRTPCALFHAAAEAGVKLVVQLSALGAEEGAQTAYHRSKKAADDCLRALPVASVVFQPSLVYAEGGASTRTFATLATLPLGVKLGRAAQLVQPVDLDDLVDAIANAVDTIPPGSRTIRAVGPAALPFADYIELLRKQMGKERRLQLVLPDAVANTMAKIGDRMPSLPFNSEALAMLNRGNVASTAGSDPAFEATLGRASRHPGRFVRAPAELRTAGLLAWLLPLLRYSIAAVWIATAWVSAFVWPVSDSLALLERTGVPSSLAPLMLYGASALDLLIGLGILLLPRRRWLWLVQGALVGFYTVVIAVKLPEFLAHPYGPLTKNLPMLAAFWLLYEFEEE